MPKQLTQRELMQRWDTLTPEAKYFIAKKYIEEHWVGHQFFRNESAHAHAELWSMSRFSDLPYGDQCAILGALKQIGKQTVKR